MWVWISIAIVVLVVGALWWGTAYVEAYIEVKNKPREQAHWCHRHGMIAKKHVLDLGVTTVCPLCYKASMDQAGKL